MQNLINIVFEYWFLFLALIFVIYQIFNYYNFSKHLNRVGKEYCDENGFEYVEIKHAKAYFSVVYKNTENNKRKYKKFRMDTSILGKVKFLEWLK